MLPLANIGLGSFLKNSLHVCVKIILSKQEGIFYLSMQGIKSLGTLKENSSRMFSLL